METAAEKITGKRWLGKGPYRIWKNRTQGGVLNVWDIEKQTCIPGEKWNYPEFEGFFDPWYWAVIRFAEGRNMGISVPEDDDLTLGILNPVNGEDPKSATWHYPEKKGIYLFHCISAVGTKWKPAEEFGPSSQPTELDGILSGTVQFSFNWNQTSNDNSSFQKEIQ
jgi:hypothetical protein